LVLSARRTFLPFVLSLVATLPAVAANWTQPTPDELKLTSDPAAPDEPAVYLFREEKVDDKLHYHSLYVRIKILTEKGKEEFSDIEIPYESGQESIHELEGRTIHSDGTIIPFTGKPYDKELVKSGNVRVMAKVFSMPDVQVGSILEYRWDLQYADTMLESPQWIVQQKVFVHKAHYHFTPFDMDWNRTVTVKDSLGKEHVANRLLWYQWLPNGAKVQPQLNNGYDQVVDNIPALPDEDYSPPLNSYSYRVLFYYSPQSTGQDFWKDEGREWSRQVDRFAEPSDAIRKAVAGIVAPGDTEEQKLRKIYAAIMTVENTRFTREHSAAENMAQGVKIKTAADIWADKRGTDDEINRLFLAMARAAGFTAWDMIVTERDRALLNTGYLDWGQLEDEIAIVEVGGKNVYFDPGQRYCQYGELHWMHTGVLGIRQTANGTSLEITPAPPYTDNRILRTADLQLASDGTLTGVVRITMTGSEALRWRQHALRGDEAATKKAFEEDLQRQVPDGVHVKTNHFLGLTDSTSSLMAIMDVSGTLGTQTGKRVFLPSGFFEAGVKPLFAEQKREAPVDLHYAYVAQDELTLNLPPGLSVEGLPTNIKVPMSNLALYQMVYGTKGQELQEIRQIELGTAVYKPEEYPQLRDFFQKTSAQDQQPIVLERTAITTAAGNTGANQ
jgi:hypothetical protein